MRFILPAVRQTYAHEAVLTMARDADVRAPGAAITVALCGHWDHQPPCPLAPHHTSADRTGDRVRLRTVFAVEPDAEHIVRQRIDEALHAGELQRPGAAITRWELQTSRPSEVAAEEAGLAESLLRS